MESLYICNKQPYFRFLEMSPHYIKLIPPYVLKGKRNAG